MANGITNTNEAVGAMLNNWMEFYKIFFWIDLGINKKRSYPINKYI